MAEDDITLMLQSIGADMEVLEAYHCQPARARVVRDMLRIRTPHGTWGLKKARIPMHHLEVIYQLTEYIAKSSPFRVPRFIKNQYGDAFTIHPTGIYYMAPWLPGRETDLRKPQHLCAAASLLSAWHQSARGFDGVRQLPTRESTIVDRLLMGQNRLLFLVKKAKQKQSPSPFERFVLASEDELIARIDLAQHRFSKARLNELESRAFKEGTVCHGRFFKKNILFDGVTYGVVNYDYAEAGSPLSEFAFYLHRYMPSYEWNLEILTMAIEAYQTNMPFHPVEFTQLAALIGAPFRPLQIIAWYQNGEVQWEEEDFIDAFELALDLEEAREHAAMGLENHVASQSITTIENGATKDGHPNDFLQATASYEPTDVCVKNPEPRKKRIRKTRPIPSRSGPAMLTSHNVSGNRSVHSSRISDEHGSEHNKQEHEDEQVKDRRPE